MLNFFNDIIRLLTQTTVGLHKVFSCDMLVIVVFPSLKGKLYFFSSPLCSGIGILLVNFSASLNALVMVNSQPNYQGNPDGSNYHFGKFDYIPMKLLIKIC